MNAVTVHIRHGNYCVRALIVFPYCLLAHFAFTLINFPFLHLALLFRNYCGRALIIGKCYSNYF